MTHFLISRLPVTLAVAGLLAAAPLTIRHDPVSGAYALDHSTAEARRGRGADDTHDDDNGGRKGGKGRDDKGADDKGGRKGGKGGKGGDDRKPDDRGGKKKHGGGGTTTPTTPGGTVSVVKVERSANELEVRYSDGTKEEVEAGRYERKDANGRTVEERPATAADIARLSAL